MLCVELHPQQRYVWVLTPDICECDLIWKSGLRRCNPVKMRSYWIMVSHNLMIGHVERQRQGDQKHRGEGHVKTEAGAELCCHKPRDAKDCWQPREAEEARKDSSLEPSEGARPCWHLDFRVLPSRSEQIYVKSPSLVICYSSPRKLIYTSIPRVQQVKTRIRLPTFLWEQDNISEAPEQVEVKLPLKAPSGVSGVLHCSLPALPYLHLVPHIHLSRFPPEHF